MAWDTSRTLPFWATNFCACQVQTAGGGGLGTCLLSSFPFHSSAHNLESHWSSDEILRPEHFLLPRTLRARSGCVWFYRCWTPILWVEFISSLVHCTGSSALPAKFLLIVFIYPFPPINEYLNFHSWSPWQAFLNTEWVFIHICMKNVDLCVCVCLLNHINAVILHILFCFWLFHSTPYFKGHSSCPVYV